MIYLIIKHFCSHCRQQSYHRRQHQTYTSVAMATSVTLPDRSFEFPTEKLAVGMGTGCHSRMSRDQSYHRLELWCSPSVSRIVDVGKYGGTERSG